MTTGSRFEAWVTNIMIRYGSELFPNFDRYYDTNCESDRSDFQVVGCHLRGSKGSCVGFDGIIQLLDSDGDRLFIPVQIKYGQKLSGLSSMYRERLHLEKKIVLQRTLIITTAKKVSIYDHSVCDIWDYNKIQQLQQQYGTIETQCPHTPKAETTQRKPLHHPTYDFLTLSSSNSNSNSPSCNSNSGKVDEVFPEVFPFFFDIGCSGRNSLLQLKTELEKLGKFGEFVVYDKERLRITFPETRVNWLTYQSETEKYQQLYPIIKFNMFTTAVPFVVGHSIIAHPNYIDVYDDYDIDCFYRQYTTPFLNKEVRKCDIRRVCGYVDGRWFVKRKGEIVWDEKPNVEDIPQYDKQECFCYTPGNLPAPIVVPTAVNLFDVWSGNMPDIQGFNNGNQIAYNYLKTWLFSYQANWDDEPREITVIGPDVVVAFLNSITTETNRKIIRTIKPNVPVFIYTEKRIQWVKIKDVLLSLSLDRDYHQNILSFCPTFHKSRYDLYISMDEALQWGICKSIPAKYNPQIKKIKRVAYNKMIQCLIITQNTFYKN